MKEFLLIQYSSSSILFSEKESQQRKRFSLVSKPYFDILNINKLGVTFFNIRQMISETKRQT